MRDYRLTHLRDEVLLHDLAGLIVQDRAITATLLAHIAEVDARKLYAPAGFASMFAYCVGELRLSEDAAAKRIQAARAARRFPLLLETVAEGRLHLSGICLLAPHLTEENAAELIAAATHRRKVEIEEMLLPRTTVIGGTSCQGQESLPALPQHAPGHVECDDSAHAPGHVVDPPTPVSLAPARVTLQFTISKDTLEKLRYATALLSHAIPSGDAAQVLDRALDVLITKLETRKAGSARASTHRRCTPGSARPVAAPLTRRPHIPAAVRRAVWERDQGRCTFVGAGDHRCASRRFLEFDHVVPVARGGRAGVEGLRLHCRTHNQYEAERAFGVDFMSRKRVEAEQARAEARERERGDRARADARDLQACLTRLGCRALEARRAAAFSAALPDKSFEERLRTALQSLARTH
jgi:5-methylcytosine-specific restriction endonuclease McrA